MLPVTDTLDILRGHLTDTTLLNAIAKDLLQAEREVKASKTTVPPAKTRLAILIRGTPEMQAAVAAGAWVLSVPDGDDATSNTYTGEGLVNRLRAAVVEHNDAPVKRRGRKVCIETWAQAMTTLRPKTIKASGSTIGVKQKGALAEVVVLTSETVEAKP